MSDFALVTCLLNEKIVNEDKGIRAFIKKFLEILKPPEIELSVKKVEFYEDISMYVIELPFSPGELAKMPAARLERVENTLKRALDGLGIHICTLPDKLSCVFKPVFSRIVPSSDNYLYRILLMNILDELCKKRRLGLEALDIGIIAGEDFQEFDTVLKLLSPHVRCLTLVAQNKETVENTADNLYNETGLSVGVTGDFANGTKSCDLIINFADLRQIGCRIRTRMKAVLLNYGEIDYGRLSEECTVINGLQLGIPNGLSFKIDKGLYNFFSKAQLSDMIIRQRLGIDLDLESGLSDVKAVKSMSGEFSRRGYSIIGFIGRRSVISANTVNLCSGSALGK